MAFKKGDKLRCINNSSKPLTLRKIYTAQYDTGESHVKVYTDTGLLSDLCASRFKRLEKGEDNMVETVKDIIHKNKTIIYTVVALCIVDHLFLKGKFRLKLQAIFSRLIDKVINRGVP